ncbi:Spermatogenesis-associated protein 20 [Lamellibrachia satsuma]|nr:Spermatogenesis-associated protein 20 [Lamellibrachia satsuma]
MRRQRIVSSFYGIALPLTPRATKWHWVKMASTSQEQKKYSNRLGLEKSPYLLQHASNPVDWYSWGTEAFDKAKQEDKPIFLSVGYSTCHWCHVMERESFESEEIGEILNKHFVSIKVDREERPDIDKIYMTFVQMTSGGGGWPMNVWLTPDLKPLVGGTYFPPDNKYAGHPGFKSVLLHIIDKWDNDREGLRNQGSSILQALCQMDDTKTQSSSSVPSKNLLMKGYAMLVSSYDTELGGFGKAPKFPQPVNLNYLFRLHASEPQTRQGEKARAMAAHTLRMMAKGGIHDHVAKGFHRYSTDSHWHVPHFEKMLYDQAQLAASYLDAYQLTKDSEFADVAQDILEYVSRDLSHPDGGFYSAEDADSHPTLVSTVKVEGAFCVWTENEVRDILTESIPDHAGVTEADVICHHYDIRKQGNVTPGQDPHGELTGKNVLIVRGSLEDTAKKFGISCTETRDILERGRQTLFEVRMQRPSPHLDDKMITSWNGLMISAYAKAGQVIDDDSYTDRALQTVQFLRTHMFRSASGVLLRSCYTSADGDTVTQTSVPIEGFSDDYAFLIQGLLDLYETSHDPDLLEWAELLQTKQNELFWDERNGGYFTSPAGDESVILRMKSDQDGAEPSANSVSALNLLRLSHYLNHTDWRDRAGRTMGAFSQTLEQVPVALPQMLCTLLAWHTPWKQIIIFGDKDASDTKELVRCVQSCFIPNKILIVVDSNNKNNDYLKSKLDILLSLEKMDGKATAFVCENFTCKSPVNTVAALTESLH